MANHTPHTGEFAFIADALAPLATSPEARNLADDVAALSGDFVVTKDMLVGGVHFRADDAPDLIARKALRVNLSDLAGKGAKPHGYFLGLALPKDTSPAWRENFVNGLAADQKEFGLTLLGGDCTSTPGPVVLSVTMLGQAGPHIPARADAKPGDDVWMTGTLGDAALALAVPGNTHFERRYLLPEPRISFGRAAAHLFHAAMDISDGLLADAAHIVGTSGVQINIDTNAVPLSDAAQNAVHETQSLWQTLLTGGDDYEVLFTASPGARSDLLAAAKATQTQLTRIGSVCAGNGVALSGEGAAHIDPTAAKGFTHF